MALATAPQIRRGDIVASATIGGDLYAHVTNVNGDQYTARVLTHRWPYEAGRVIVRDTSDTRVLDAPEIIANTLEVNTGFRAHKFYPGKGLRQRRAVALDDGADPADYFVIAHYFCATGDRPWPTYYIVDFGDGDETGLAYGYAHGTGNGPGHDDCWRYFSLIELEQHLIVPDGTSIPFVYERDPHWVPRRARAALHGITRDADVTR